MKKKLVYLHENVNRMRVDILTVEQSNEILRYLDLPHSLIWEIGTSTGLRISDILSFKVSDFYKRTVYVREKKTGKRRRIYLRKHIREQGILYAKKMGYKKDSNIFRITRQGAWKAIKRATQKAHISTNVGTHSMRKTYSKNYILKGYSAQDLQNRLNHSRLNDTIGYLTLNSDLGLDDNGRKKRKGRKNESSKNNGRKH